MQIVIIDPPPGKLLTFIIWNEKFVELSNNMKMKTRPAFGMDKKQIWKQFLMRLIEHRCSPPVRTETTDGSRDALTRTLNTQWLRSSSCPQVLPAGCRWSRILTTPSTRRSPTATRPLLTPRGGASSREKS